jgi:hypothetical protein
MITNIRNDKKRVQKEMEISSFACRYHLDAPGPGVQVGYIESPHIRLQHWAANVYTDQLGLENELTNRYNKQNGQDRKQSIPMHRYINPNQAIVTRESRTDLPAWIFRDKDSQRENISLHGQHDIYSYNSTVSSRLLPKSHNQVAFPFDVLF